MITKLLRTSCIVLFLITHLSSHASWQWTKVAPLANGKRFESTSFSINGKGYVTCGVDTNDNCYNDLWQYDPVFNFWTQKANLPASYRRAAFGFELNGKGYLGCGSDDALTSLGTVFNDFWMYDPTTNTWTAKASAPISTYRAAGVSCNGKGYMICGANPSGWSAYSDVYEYNPISNNWASKTWFPGVPTSSGGREGGTATSVGNKIYFGMGKDDSYFQNDWWEFNPLTNNWARKADFPSSGRTGAWAFTINGMACVGMGSDGGFTSDTWWYDVTANTWNYTCAFTNGGRRSVAAFAIGNVGYMGTGKSSGGTKQDFYRLDADVSINENKLNSNLVSVFPNPISTNEFKIHVETELVNATISILDINGKLIKIEQLNGTELIINRTEIEAGLYFISIQNQNQILSIKKIILL